MPPAPTLAEALDCDFTITTGGNSNWYVTTSASESYYGGDAVKSGSIDNNGQTWIQTTVTAVAGDKASFYWKVSSQSGCDYLKFYIDGVQQCSISGEVDWEKKSYSLSAGSRTLKWVYSKDSSGYSGNDCGWVDGLVVGTGSLYPQPGIFAEATDCDLPFTTSGSSTWSKTWGSDSEYYFDADAAKSGSPSGNGESLLQAIVESDSSETIKFHWKVSCQTNYDYLRFYIDGTLKDSITGEVDWQQKSYGVSAGIHTLKWVYDDGGGSTGDDCGWVDFVQWTGPSPQQDPSNWQAIDYKHDVYGRRSEKKVDGYGTRYLYDGPHVIAEYDGNNNLLRKYIYGPGIDQPVCMIEVAESNAAYYYHFDGLGSVVALSDSSGDTVQTYQYSVYGQVAVEDINHTNPYMFAGVRYDIEIGLYYNRARYYNPFTGRFLQTDPIGYGDGMNLYRYCRNNPLDFADPSGSIPIHIEPDWPAVVDAAIWLYKTLGISIPPPFPGPWNQSHWWWHYFLGGGKPVDLGKVGLLETFRSNQGVSEAEIKFEMDTLRYAKNKVEYLRKCNEVRRANGIEELDNAYLERRDRYTYNFGNMDYIGSLFVLGSGYLNMFAFGYVYEDGTFEITLQFEVRDWFKDPADLRNRIRDYLLTLEILFGNPFEIIANYEYTISGDVDWETNVSPD